MDAFVAEVVEISDGVSFLVKAHAGSRINDLNGCHDGALRVRVTQAPEKGKANKAICALLAKILGVSKSSVTVLSGETASLKRVAVKGLNKNMLLSKLDPFLKP